MTDLTLESLDRRLRAVEERLNLVNETTEATENAEAKDGPRFGPCGKNPFLFRYDDYDVFLDADGTGSAGIYWRTAKYQPGESCSWDAMSKQTFRDMAAMMSQAIHMIAPAWLAKHTDLQPRAEQWQALCNAMESALGLAKTLDPTAQSPVDECREIRKRIAQLETTLAAVRAAAETK